MPDEPVSSLTPLPRFLRTDLHVHSTFSDGRATVDALVARAREKGLTLAITDHLSIDQKINAATRLPAYINDLERYPVYRGVEVDIGEEIIIPAESRARLDLVIGSMHNVTSEPGQRYQIADRAHPQLDEYMEYYVAALVRGITSGIFTFIGHPTFLVGLPAQSQQQHDALWTAPRRHAVIDAAVASGVAFEISTRYNVPSPTFMQEAIEAGMTFAIGSDSHWLDRIGEFALPRRYIAEFELTPDRFIVMARTIEGNDVVYV